MHTDFLLNVFEENLKNRSLVWRGQSFNYSTLLERVRHWMRDIDTRGIEPGTVIGLEGDFSPNTLALFFALVEKNCIVVPQTNASRVGREMKDEIAQVEAYFRCDRNDDVTWEMFGRSAQHPYYQILRERKVPGLVLFSSGTSGKPKAAVHDFTALLEKFRVRRRAFVTLNFMLFDHWGGLNTMLHTLSNGATIVTVEDRSPEAVCDLIEKTQAELLPATPTFLNLMLLSGVIEKHNLGSLKIISYGAEPMLQSTLSRLRETFPKVNLLQTYGLIEVGVLRSKSRDDHSLWVKIGGEGYQTRVVEGILQIKTKSTILGYLNAEAPITEDGWFITGDAVKQDGDYFQILGRKSEMINVGGEKVYPAEVESVIQSMKNISEVTVYAEKNPIIGNILCVKVSLLKPEDSKEFTARLKQYCQERLERFKIPVKVKIVDSAHHGERFKKNRTDMEKENQTPRYGFYGRLTEQFPSQVIVDVTELCNLACIHCPHPTFKESEHYGGRHLDPALNTKLVDELRDFGSQFAQYIRYTSMGEPLLHPNIFEMLTYAKQNSKVLVALTTNGKTLREKQIEKLLDIGVDLIDISIDAYLDETYAMIRVGGNLKVTRANVLGLIKRKKERQSPTKIVVSYIEQPQNTHETHLFETYWREQGADYVVVRRLHSAAGGKPDIAASLWEANKKGVRNPCVYPWERIVLRASSTLSFCPADWNNGSSFVDYRTTTIRETWNGEFYRKLRQAHLENNYSCHSFCGQCPDWSVIKWPDEGKAYADMVHEFKREGADVSVK